MSNESVGIHSIHTAAVSHSVAHRLERSLCPSIGEQAHTLLLKVIRRDMEPAGGRIQPLATRGIHPLLELLENKKRRTHNVPRGVLCSCEHPCRGTSLIRNGSHEKRGVLGVVSFLIYFSNKACVLRAFLNISKKPGEHFQGISYYI